jgi:hypothetical protein
VSGGLVVRSGVHCHHRLELRTGHVVRLNPGEVPVDEFGGGQLTVLQRGVEGGDGELFELGVDIDSLSCVCRDDMWLGR